MCFWCWHLSLIFVLLFEQIKKLTCTKVWSGLFTMEARQIPTCHIYDSPVLARLWGLASLSLPRSPPGVPSLECQLADAVKKSVLGWVSGDLGFSLAAPRLGDPEDKILALQTWHSTTHWLSMWQFIVCPGKSGAVLILPCLLLVPQIWYLNSVTQSQDKKLLEHSTRFLVHKMWSPGTDIDDVLSPLSGDTWVFVPQSPKAHPNAPRIAGGDDIIILLSQMRKQRLRVGKCLVHSHTARYRQNPARIRLW